MVAFPTHHINQPHNDTFRWGWN